MTTASRDFSRVLASAAALGLGVLGWLGAQWLTYGILEQAHLFAGDLAGHHHRYAAPLAAAAAIATTAALGLLVVRARFSSPTPRAVSEPSPACGGGALAAVSVLLFAAAEVTEFAFATNHHVAPLITVLVLGTVLQSAAALLTRSVWSFTLGSIARFIAFPGPMPTRRSAPSTLILRAPELAGSRWSVRLVPGRGPPLQSAS